MSHPTGECMYWACLRLAPPGLTESAFTITMIVSDMDFAWMSLDKLSKEHQTLSIRREAVLPGKTEG